MSRFIRVLLVVLMLASCAEPEQGPAKEVTPSATAPTVSAPTIIVSSSPDAPKPVLITGIHSIADNRDKAEKAIQEHVQLEKKVANMDAASIPPLPPPPAPIPVKPETQLKIVAENTVNGISAENFVIITSREVIYSSKSFQDTPINVILFPHKPITVTELSNYQFICEIWQANFPKTEEVRKRFKPEEVVTIPMYWMAASRIKGETCSEYVKNYDYARSQFLALKYHLDPNRVQILSIMKTNTIAMDMTTLNRQSEIELALSAWRRKMCFKPKNDNRVYAYNLYTSTKEVLGALGPLLAIR